MAKDLDDPAAVDAYLAGVPDDFRAPLEALRRRIKAAVPDATQAIGYGVVMFKLHGHPLIGMGAAKKHCALYGATDLASLGDPDLIAALSAFDISKGTIRFTPERPLPASVVRRLVKARAAQIEARWGKA